MLDEMKSKHSVIDAVFPFADTNWAKKIHRMKPAPFPHTDPTVYFCNAQRISTGSHNSVPSIKNKSLAL